MLHNYFNLQKCMRTYFSNYDMMHYVYVDIFSLRSHNGPHSMVEIYVVQVQLARERERERDQTLRLRGLNAGAIMCR